MKNFISITALVISLWLISGQSINTILQSPVIAQLERANVFYHMDVYDYCANRSYGAEYGVETFEDCLLNRALNVEEESYVVPLVMSMGYDRDMAEVIVTALYEEFCNQDAYYGMG